MDVQVKALVKERDNKILNLAKTLRGGQMSMTMGAFGNAFVVYCEKRVMDEYRKLHTVLEPMRIEYEDRIFRVQQQYLGGLVKQKHLASTLVQVSPITVYESLMSALSGTDLVNFEYYRNRVKLHTNEVIEYIRSKTENFSSPAYFTPSKEEDFEEWRKDSDRKLEQTPPLNLQDLPQFSCGPESFAKALRRTFPNITLLIFINALFFTLSFVAFLKYDVR